MNELLQQLVGMAPGLGQAAAGNGPQFASFMQGWQRAAQRDEERRRLEQQDQIAAEDRTRQMSRQDAADARATDDQTWQQQQRLLSLAQLLNQSGAQAETLPEAEGAIDSTFGLLNPEQQSKLAPVRDQSMIGAQRAITGRQKKQVEAFVDAAMKMEHVANTPDADPELVNLPEHIQKIIGKPTARLSELQQYAALPVGKPAGKPSDEVSWQIKDGIGPDGKPGVFRINPKTGATEPVRGIRPEPPRPTQSDPEIAELRKDLLQLQVDKAREGEQPRDSQFLVAGYAARMEQAEPSLADVSQTIVSMPLVKFQLQTEGWFAKPTFQSREVQAYMQAARNFINANLRRESGATIQPHEFQEAKAQYLPVPGDDPETLAMKAANRRLVFDTMRRSAGKAYEPPPLLFRGGTMGPAPRTSAGVKVGDPVRNRKTGELAEVVAIRPDGSLVLKPKQ